MGDLENRLVWSHSRQATFDSCKRKYYYHYYGSWGGWNSDAPGLIRQAYLLKNLDGLDAYVGSLVHKHISRVCANLSYGKAHSLDPNTLAKELDRAFIESTDDVWYRDPKRRTRFFEDHYNGGISAELKESKKQKAVACIKAFLGSRMFAQLQQYATQIHWLWIDPPRFSPNSEFSLGDCHAFGKLDLAFKSAGKVYLIDFKTGKQDASEQEQIGVYALFAKDKWACETDAITCGMVALYPEYSERRYAVTDQSLAEVEERIKIGYSEMVTLHEAGLNYQDSSFSPSKRKCEWCNFKEICKT
ncbi:MAG: PD-(D/E)XK nuclease family protein [Armatimonadota bacterium]|nr:PD-(D/E)XK nuclease family protein [bacterium]